MKKIQKQITIFIIGVVLAASCTGGFEDNNTAKTAITPAQQDLDHKTYQIPLQILSAGIYLQYSGIALNWPWQITQNLTSDIYSGYLHPMKGDWFKNTPSYAYNNGWNMSYQYTYQSIAPALMESVRVNADRPDFLGITKILKVELLHRMADLYGPILYSNYGINVTPDSMEDAYKAMFNDLDEAIVMLDKWQADNPGINRFTEDILTKDKLYSSWVKFANSLRLRLAMRVSFVDKSLAKIHIKKAIACGKFLEKSSTDDIAAHGGTYTNPLATIVAWGDSKANANMGMYMNGYEDPRRTKYFANATDAPVDPEIERVPPLFSVDGKIIGIPLGVAVTDNRYEFYSKPRTATNTPAYLLTAAETWFLRSEAALRGFTDEDAEDCYEKGVKASFDQWSAGDASAYLKSDNIPASYIDQFDTKWNQTLTTKITPKWGESQEDNFQRIAIQKWLAVFPEGDEGWAIQRRMGYPELMKVGNNLSTVVNRDLGPRRLRYSEYVSIGQSELHQKLVGLLGGLDNEATRLWWDVDTKTL